MENTANNWLKKAPAKNESIVCIAFDIDNLTAINDEYGHLFGGDEFVIILKDISLEYGEMKAIQLLEAIRGINIFKDGQTILVTASIGVTDNADCSVLHFNELFNLADMKLYEAKQNGKNQIYVLN